ncbi:uncharacterized protein BJ212DRAFT_1479467 [Suillus subaureus]|uniref:Uncharacterized protein n=1 Tax=Suillus subaureus TaxID=48587 RepID=A0A9P7EE20_9AGAM|nr:uncharacterized protein BJ212DRAFT_1479467 [Suillus subaureus]KAG1818455.1 hypothetical protein BJ212DRAFT_1479467 [Suillus subaureus]
MSRHSPDTLLQVDCKRAAPERERTNFKPSEQRGIDALRFHFSTYNITFRETPQTRRETLKKAAELLRQLSSEHEATSRHEPLPPLEFSSASPYEVDEGSHTSYEPLVIPNNETWTNAITPWMRNSSPISDTSATSSMVEYQGHPQAEIHHVVGGGGDWNLVQPTPTQFRQTSFSAQWSLIHSNIDQVPYYKEWE